MSDDIDPVPGVSVRLITNQGHRHNRRPQARLAADIVDNGIALAGVGALIRGLDNRLADAVALSVRVADGPAYVTLRGTGVVLDELDFLSKCAKKR